jgi:class 3 adenylate cyclase/predicted ATPase
MTDVGRWLQELGIAQYARAFAENDIDLEVLPHLNEQDLEKLGVSLGHRKKLLHAIALLADAPATTGKSDAAERPRAEAERRQLSVMFVDLVGSTALSAGLDPEDMGRVIRAYQDCCSEAVERWGGHVAKYMGDGVLAYFGWPQAHEDEAERAVRAGLAIIDALAGVETPTGDRLAARVGIATGLVMVGELIGEGAAREEAVVGETPNLAARLQALAEPSSVVISQATRRLVGGLFELADLGALQLKGFAEPVRAWRVEGAGRAEGRFEALHGEHLTPLVGREHELGILLERWAWAKDGDGQVVLLAGEPGIGKSRLIRALRERLGDEPHTPVSHYCSPYHSNSALHPVIGLLERAARLDRDEAPEAQLARLEAMLARSSDRLDEVVPLLAALLGVPTGGRYPSLTLTPEMQKQRTLRTLVDQLAGLAKQRPVLALYEDLHWVDPSTLELLGLVIERIRGLPVLALITFRPEFQPPWTGHAHVTTLTMSRLGRRQGADLVARVTGAKSLPAAIVEQIVARTDGVPLFVEELTKTVLESGLLADAGGHYELSGPLPPLAIPTTLHDSLMARLDRLAAVKEVAQIGAVIGREFSHELLAAVSLLPETDLSAALEQLVQSELVFRRGAPAEATYSFKHALIQEAAYQSLLKSKRQQLHGRIAEVLEEQFPETIETQPQLLAHHWTEAGRTDKAVDYWERSGQRSIAGSAMAEAVAQLRRGLEVLQGLPDGPERQQRELGLQVALGRALIPAKGFAAPDTGRAYVRARELCLQLGNTPQLFPILYGQYVFHFERAELDAADEVAWELLRLAQERTDAAAQVTGHRIVGSVTFQLGRLPVARTHLEQGLALYDAVRDRNSGLVYAIDSRVICSTWLSHGLFALGFPEQAQAHSTEALGYARELAHPPSLALALWRACSFHRFSRDADAVRQLAEARIALAAEQGFPQDLAAGEFDRNWALLTMGQVEGCMAQMQSAMAAYRATGAERGAPADLADLAEAHRKAAQPAKARALLADALSRVERTGERWYEAELHRRMGELLLYVAEPDRGAAEGCFHRAMAVARKQSAKMWELRVAMSLARLRVEQGRRAEAYDLLAPVYGWFTEGFDTADLKDAKALLDELR